MTKYDDSTGELAVGVTAVFPHPCVLTGVVCRTDGTHNGRAKIYDNESAASGRIMAGIQGPGEAYCGSIVGLNVRAHKGITVEVIGEGATAYLFYRTAFSKMINGVIVHQVE